MMKYEKTLKRRVILCRVLIVFLLVMMILLAELSSRGVLLDSRLMTGLAQQVQRSIIFGGIILLLVYHRRAARLLRNETEKNEQEIRENDERRRYIHDRSSTLTLELLFIAGLTAVLVLSFVDMAAFTAAYCFLIGGMLIKGASYIYYKAKVG